jgi:hypothetical protein
VRRSEPAALAAVGANRNQTSGIFASSPLRTYYGDLLVNFDYDPTEDLSLKVSAGVNTQDRYSRATSRWSKSLIFLDYMQ